MNASIAKYLRVETWTSGLSPIKIDAVQHAYSRCASSQYLLHGVISGVHLRQDELKLDWLEFEQEPHFASRKFR
jgi:hypothetical protein